MKDEYFTKNIRYSPKYGTTLLDLPHLSLPPSLHYESIDFEVKHEFHCSIMNTRRIAEHYGVPEERLVETVRHALAQQPVIFRHYTSDFYHCRKEEKQTVIVLVEISGLEEVYQLVREQVGLADLPSPMPHVTLYKYNCVAGIAVPNEAALTQLCRPVEGEVRGKLKEMLEG